MSEQKVNYMSVLDQWTETNVFAPLLSTNEEGEPAEEVSEETLEQVKKAIREKVLESYHNGQNAGPRRITAPATPQARYQPSWRRPQ